MAGNSKLLMRSNSYSAAMFKADDPRLKRAVSLSGAETASHAAPFLSPRRLLRQMQHDAPHRALDPSAELKQALAQGRHLRLRAVGAGSGGAHGFIARPVWCLA